MKIYLASDIHVEFHKKFTAPSTPVDLVVLAGDIHTSKNVLKVAKQFNERCNAPVLVVLGNHEFYGCDYVKHLAALRAEAAELEGVHLLEKDIYVQDDVRFLGCTLWTNFGLHGRAETDACKVEALRNIADFSSIKHEGRRFNPDDALALFQQSYRWLQAELAQPFVGRTVVVTHFLPHRAGVHQMHAKGKDLLTAYFTVDCSGLMEAYSIDAWMYGHTHNSVDLLLDNGVRLVSNQRGYPNEPSVYTQFNPEKIIEIATRVDPDKVFSAVEAGYGKPSVSTTGNPMPYTYATSSVPSYTDQRNSDGSPQPGSLDGNFAHCSDPIETAKGLDDRAEWEHEQSRRIEAEMRERMYTAVLAGTQWLTFEDVVRRANSASADPEVDPERWVREGAIFSILHGGVVLYPAFALDPNNRQHPYPQLAEVISQLAPARNGWQMASWFVAVNGPLGGSRPCDRLVSHSKEVIAAAYRDRIGIQHG